MTDEIDADDIDRNLVAQFRQGVTAVELDGEAVLLDGETGVVFTLNPTATLVWRCCDGAARLGEIIDDIAFVFEDTEQGRVEVDVLALVKEVGRRGLLVGVRAEVATGQAHNHRDQEQDDDGEKAGPHERS